MKFKKEYQDDHQVKITLEVEPSQLSEYRLRAVRKISSQTKIAGFRPGKAPLDVVKRLYGNQTLEEEAQDLLVHDLYPTLIEEAKIKPSGPGRLEKTNVSDPPKFVFIIPLEPEVKLGDYHAIRLAYTPEKVKDYDIEKVLHRLQLNLSTAEPVEREIRKGDLVEVKITATVLKPSQGENAEVLKDSPLQIIIGENESGGDQFPFAGFDIQLIGLINEEEKQFKHKYPKDSIYEKLQGKDVEFSIKVQSVRTLKKPEMNDEFSKSLGGYENFQGLRESVQKELQQSKDREYDDKFFQELFDKIIKVSTIKYPPQVLKDETDRVLHNFEHSLSNQNLDLTTYLKLNKLEQVKFIEEEIKPEAIHQLEQTLVLEEIRNLEKIELEKGELQKEYSQSFSELQSTQDFQRLRRQFSTKGLANRVLLQTATRLVNKRVELRLKDIVTGNYSSKQDKSKKDAKKETSLTAKTILKKKKEQILILKKGKK